MPQRWNRNTNHRTRKALLHKATIEGAHKHAVDARYIKSRRRNGSRPCFTNQLLDFNSIVLTKLLATIEATVAIDPPIFARVRGRGRH
jgi:uncharacterized membrane protein